MLNSTHNTTPINVFGLDSVNYPKHRGKLIDLYSLSFTEGDYAQYIPEDAIESSLDEIMRIGFGFMAFQKAELVGAVLCLSLKNDPDFPHDSYMDIHSEKTLYIADLMVNPLFRGIGVAKGLLKHLFDRSQSTPYEAVMIRVWDENSPAMSLYKKLGFEEITMIYQTKLQKDSKEPFVMKKIYMFRKL